MTISTVQGGDYSNKPISCSLFVTIYPAQNKRTTQEIYNTLSCDLVFQSFPWGVCSYIPLATCERKGKVISPELFHFRKTIIERELNTTASVGKQFSFSLRTESSCVFKSVAKRCCSGHKTNQLLECFCLLSFVQTKGIRSSSGSVIVSTLADCSWSSD